MYIFDNSETKSLKKLMENCKMNDASIDAIDKFLSLELGFLCDEQLYIDKMRVGSQLFDAFLFRAPPPIQELELVILRESCPYFNICPLTKDEIIPSFYCKMCYMGRKCSSSDELGSNEKPLEEIVSISRKLAPDFINISGITFQEYDDVENLVDLLKNNIKVKGMVLNIPYFDMIYGADRIKKILSKFTQDAAIKFLLNISLFPTEGELLKNFLETIHRDDILLKHSVITLCFDFNDTARIASVLREDSFKNLFIFLAPYLKDDGLSLTDINAIRGLETLTLNWLRVPPLDIFSLLEYRNYIPCLSSTIVIDSNLNIANCKGYWMKGQTFSMNRRSFKDIFSKWREDENDSCFQCALRLGCFSCKIFMDHLSRKLGSCFIRDSLFKVKSTL